MRIGIFGGAFDPPHRGHEKAALAFLDKAGLDLLYVIPSGKPPHKRISGGADDMDRLEMTKLAFLPLSDKIRISDHELTSCGTCYSYLTVERIRDLHPEGEIFLFIGTDQFLVFETWCRFEYILQMCTLCVMDRFEDFSKLNEKKAWLEENFKARVLLLEEKPYIISSTDVRRDLEKWGFSSSISPLVNEYVDARSIYSVHSPSDRNELLQRARNGLSQSRFFHTLSVEREVVRICSLLSFSEEDTREMALAALFHDLAKEIPEDDIVLLLEQRGETVTDEDRAIPAVLHGRAAAFFAEDDGRFSHDAIQAVRYHTTGREGMSLKEKILYFADYSEETRSHEACRVIRTEFYENFPENENERLDYFDRFVCRVMENTAAYLEKKGIPCHSLGAAALSDMKKRIN